MLYKKCVSRAKLFLLAHFQLFLKCIYVDTVACTCFPTFTAESPVRARRPASRSLRAPSVVWRWGSVTVVRIRHLITLVAAKLETCFHLH